jgi:hypothetical protein
LRDDLPTARSAPVRWLDRPSVREHPAGNPRSGRRAAPRNGHFRIAPIMAGAATVVVGGR